MLLKLVRQFAPRHASERRTHTPNRSCYICTAHLAQVLIATSFRAASSQPTVTPLSLSTCMGAYRKFLEMSSSCGDNDDDARGKCRVMFSRCPPRTGTTCASDACVGFIASVTVDAVQEMSTGLASCSCGPYAGYQVYADGAFLTSAVLSTASECGLTSALTPLPLSTCMGVFKKGFRLEPAIAHYVRGRGVQDVLELSSFLSTDENSPTNLGSGSDARSLTVFSAALGGKWIRNGQPFVAEEIQSQTASGASTASALWTLCIREGIDFKAVQLRVTSSSGNLYAIAVRAGYTKSADADCGTWPLESISPVAGGFTANGYGVASLGYLIAA